MDTTHDPDREEAYIRAMSIARSCMTREQLNVARQYANRLRDRYEGGPDCDLLDQVIAGVDKKLFPDS